MSYSNGIVSLQHTINSSAPQEATPTVQATVSKSVAKEGQSIANVGHDDQTNLSSTGGLVAQALESSDVRSAKVTALQQAIEAGSYSVSPSDVADKIIQSLLG